MENIADETKKKQKNYKDSDSDLFLKVIHNFEKLTLVLPCIKIQIELKPDVKNVYGKHS